MGNLSLGTLQTTLNNVVVYDSNGDPRTLTVLFVNNASSIQGEWLVTVTDPTNTINQTAPIRFQVGGTIQSGYNNFSIMNPAVQGGTPTSIDFYFGEPGSYTVTNFSGGTSSSIVISDINGMPKPDGHEQPQQNIIIQKAELLTRDRSLPNPNQTTAITVGGNLNPSDPNHTFEFEFYSGSLLVSGIDEAGLDSLLKLSFTNQSTIQSGQWLLEIYWNGTRWGAAYQLLFDTSGNMISAVKIITLSSTWMFNINLNIGNIRSLNSGGTSSTFVSSIDGNSHWNQYVPITPAQFEQLINIK